MSEQQAEHRAPPGEEALSDRLLHNLEGRTDESLRCHDGCRRRHHKPASGRATVSAKGIIHTWRVVVGNERETRVCAQASGGGVVIVQGQL